MPYRHGGLPFVRLIEAMSRANLMTTAFARCYREQSILSAFTQLTCTAL